METSFFAHNNNNIQNNNVDTAEFDFALCHGYDGYNRYYGYCSC